MHPGGDLVQNYLIECSGSLNSNNILLVCTQSGSHLPPEASKIDTLSSVHSSRVN